jgi:hypothetical protein
VDGMLRKILEVLKGLVFWWLQKQGQLTLRDLKRCKLSGNFFNILFNLNKFVAFETRDPFLIRQVYNMYLFILGFTVRSFRNCLWSHQ